MELSLESLDKRLRLLEDIEEIRNLRKRYHVFINEEQFGRVAELYTADANVVLDSVGHARGTAEIDALYRKIPENADIVRQFIHNHVVEVDGDTARGLSYLDARYGKDGESLLVAARFEETYARQAEGWLISETLVTIYFAAPVAPGWGIADNKRIGAWE